MLIDIGYLLGLAFSIFMIVITIITWRNTEIIKNNRESFGEGNEAGAPACTANCTQFTDEQYDTIWNCYDQMNETACNSTSNCTWRGAPGNEMCYAKMQCPCIY